MAKRRGNGEGSITKRKDGRWQGYVTVGYDPEKDQPKKKYFYGKTRKEVQDKVNEVIAKVAAQEYQEQKKMKVSDWFNYWIKECKIPDVETFRQTTWESYKMTIDKHILPTIGHLYLTQLETQHLRKLLNDKKKDGARLDGKPGPLSNRSVRYIHMITKACLEQARKEGKLNLNPADHVTPPAEKNREIQCLDQDGVTKFLAAARPTKHFPAYFLELATGLRRGELLGLRWQDVDFKNRSITVNQGLVRIKEGLVFQPPKTARGYRTINIPQDVINELKFHRKRQMTEMENAGTAYQDNGLVFCNELGQPYCPRGFTRHFERLLQKAGMPKINFHALRHSYATLCLQQGVDYRTTSENLGHFKTSFTMDVYSHVTDRMRQTATDKIGNLLAACLGK